MRNGARGESSPNSPQLCPAVKGIGKERGIPFRPAGKREIVPLKGGSERREAIGADRSGIAT